MEARSKFWDLFADWCPTNSWSSNLAVSDSFWQAQEEIFGFLDRLLCSDWKPKKSAENILRIGETTWQAQQLEHTVTCPNAPLYCTVCKQSWCAGKQVVADILYQRHVMTKIISARCQKKPLWGLGNTKRHCTDPSITVTCFSGNMNPHEEVPRLSRFLKHLKVEFEISKIS